MPRLGPPYTSRRSHLSGKRFDEKGGDPFFDRRKMFLPKTYSFYTDNFLYPPLVPMYYFLLAHTLFFFVHTYNLRHYLFWKHNN
jgi:hypothetical protein